jgi:hypothetical protein
MKIVALALLALLPISIAQASDSVYSHINTPQFAVGAGTAYAQKIATDVQRAKIIAAAQDECGGRYEGTETKVTELSAGIEIDKNVLHTPRPNDYKLAYAATSENRWLVVETVNCSIHEGHYSSVLHASIVTGTEKSTITYTFVNDKQVGGPAISNTTRTYSLGTTELAGEFKTPYGTVIP